MKKNLKSVWAVVAGILANVVLSSVTDFIMIMLGVFSVGPIFDTGIIILLLAYRALYTVVGFWVTGKLAPENPVKHMTILLGIGVVLGATGAIMNSGLGPWWYGWGIVVLSVPAYFVAKSFFKN